MTHTAMTAAEVTELAARLDALEAQLAVAAGTRQVQAAARGLAEVQELVAAHHKPARAKKARPSNSVTVDPTWARSAARDFVQSGSVEAANEVTRTWRGRELDAVAALLGVTVHGTVLAKRTQLADNTIRRMLTSGAVSGVGSAAALASWRDRMLERLGWLG